VIAQRLFPKVDGGRVPAIEIMIANQAVKNLIREGKTGQLKSVVETSRNEGMMTFEQSIEDLVKAKKIIT
jgi:twitching motility protein PilT